MTDLDVRTLRDAYDARLRAYVPDPAPAGVTVERDGPLIRVRGLDPGGFLTYRRLDGLDGAGLDELIARQRALFAERGEPVEWKLHGHDEPVDLPDRLRAAGFEPQAQETVMIGPVAPLADTLPVPPEGVRLREVTARADLDRIAALETAVWGDPREWLADGLEKEIAADPGALTVVVAEAGPRDDAPDGDVVAAGWVRYVPGTGFATLWGGSTLPEWRQRGIYRALVAYRARLASARGHTLLQVDASDDSRPILQRLGFVAVTTTTPYVYTP
ncbi:Ribosomal protein S18 acetylase RimI [Micromonospora pattaloongensis]|uniref:Ribosomal protein S18 acetylase RimI n=1 Tax=Micromonospora pattaloongensis TaxID=405436 RepID=A0A1H3FH73_9ACTN|nr:GNAT family N-acetyltransferase [Micromonospora pattaloongensis]SDX90195.1 Ribosomal protein S18 acetylase RimI [Micromonospora pattaloongensis]